MHLTTIATPDEEDLKQLGRGLRHYNEAFVPKTEPEKLATFIKTDAGEVLGGCYGIINWGWLQGASKNSLFPR